MELVIILPHIKYITIYIYISQNSKYITTTAYILSLVARIMSLGLTLTSVTNTLKLAEPSDKNTCRCTKVVKMLQVSKHTEENVWPMSGDPTLNTRLRFHFSSVGTFKNTFLLRNNLHLHYYETCTYFSGILSSMKQGRRTCVNNTASYFRSSSSLWGHSNSPKSIFFSSFISNHNDSDSIS
jgi:hypothetical protein